MSWSTTLSPIAKADVIAAIINAQITSPTVVTDEMKEQLYAAKTAAIAIFTSGTIGESDYYTISLGGHANPNCDKPLGWVHDSVYVSVQQSDPPRQLTT